MRSMEITSITPENRSIINEFLMKHWYSTDMVVCGEKIDMTKLDGLAVFSQGEITALLTYRIKPDHTCEIISLDSLIENQGTATKLLQKVFDIARTCSCKTVTVMTTNDNLKAIDFYQKRGFDKIRLHYNTVEKSRKIKPEIPLLGDHGIPLRHELEFEYNLKDHA